MKRLKTRKAFLVISLFSLFSVALLLMANSVKNELIKAHIDLYMKSVANSIEGAIKAKKRDTLNIALALSQDSKLLAQVADKTFQDLSRFSYNIHKIHPNYKNLWIQFVDKEGYSRFRSWSDKRGDKIALVRKDLAKLLKNPVLTSSISVGRYDLTFKGIAPVFVQGKFMGLLEVISHFNSIAKDLTQQKIISAIVVDKRFTKQLTHHFSKHIIQGHYVANLYLPKEVEAFFRRHDIHRLLKIKNYQKIEQYYILSAPIKDIEQNRIAYYLAFIPEAELGDLFNISKYATWLSYTAIGLLIFYFFYLLMTKLRSDKIEIEQELLQKEVDKQTQKLKDSYYKDPLTHSFNRNKLNEDIAEQKDFVMLMLNIDNFSYINAAYGFSFGDKVLKEVVKKIRTLFDNRLYRINADEFVILSDEEYRILMQKIIDAFSYYLRIDKVQIKLTFSFGIYMCHDDANNALRKSEMALKEAKKQGKNRFVVYSDTHIQTRKDFIHANYLVVQAFKEHLFVLFYQGIRDNKTQSIEKYEALIRIRSNGKLIAPNTFLEAAKIGGFLTQMTHLVIDQSLAALSRMKQSCEISINITEDDLQSDELLEFLLKVCREYGINPNRITLEILEGISASGSKSHTRYLQKIKSEGFKIAIDDFGVEYSNFERIAELEVDFIKIDGKYIKNIDTNKRHKNIVEAIVYFAKTMHIEVVAEFVHNASVQEVVQSLGIEYSQGYYFSEPKPIEELV